MLSLRRWGDSPWVPSPTPGGQRPRAAPCSGPAEAPPLTVPAETRLPVTPAQGRCQCALREVKQHREKRFRRVEFGSGCCQLSELKKYNRASFFHFWDMLQTTAVWTGSSIYRILQILSVNSLLLPGRRGRRSSRSAPPSWKLSCGRMPGARVTSAASVLFGVRPGLPS